MARKVEWIPELRRESNKGLTFIPNLFRVKNLPGLNKNDPFISPEVLKDHCSLLATNNEGIPNFATNNPIVDDIIDFSAEDWAQINQTQDEYEKIAVEKEEEETKAREVKEIQNQQKAVAESQAKQTIDRKVDNIFKQHHHFVKKTCPVMIPFKSSLNHEEHKTYLRAFIKFKIKSPVTPSEIAEYENYLSLQNRVLEEQQCFMQFAYKVSRLQIKMYNEVPNVINEYINQYVSDKCRRVSNYKRLYVQEQVIPICPQDPQNRFSDLYMNHMGHLLSLGSVPKLNLPNPHKLCRLPLDSSVKEKLAEKDTEPDKNILHKTTVSLDKNAIYLAQKHCANIVVSSSALKVLTDNRGPNFDKEWDIPVVVRSYDVIDDDGNVKQQRVVFIDKPLPKKIWTPSEKKEAFYKKSALTSMTEIKQQGFFRMRCPFDFKMCLAKSQAGQETENEDQKNISVSRYTEDFLDLFDTTDHDVFGHSSPVKKTKSIKRKSSENPVKKIKLADDNENTCDENSDIMSPTGNENLGDMSQCVENVLNKEVETNVDVINKDDDTKVDPYSSVQKNEDSKNPVNALSNKPSSSVLDNLLDMQDSLLKPIALSNSPTKQEQGSTERGTKLYPWSNTLQTNWEEHDDVANCRRWTGENYHYQLFSMGFNNSKPFSTAPPIRVIVRHHLHGLSFFNKTRGKSKAFILYAKPEYQSYFGCEINTLSEITNQWLDLLVRPNTTLLELRVCQSTGDIMMIEEKTLASILKEGKQQHIGFTPQQPLSTLYAVFQSLSAQPTGDYVLHHDIKTEAFIKLLKATNSTDIILQTMDLHCAYATPSAYTRTHAKPPWIALDTHKITPFHKKHYKIPGTFPMENPNKKLSKKEKKRIKDKAKLKRRLDEVTSKSPEKNDG